jgi:hypothetical protein
MDRAPAPGGEPLQLQPEEETGDAPGAKPPWVEEAYRLFGEDMVELKED